jgi:hypothetical protein
MGRPVRPKRSPLLWTPTPGDDVTQMLFPLSKPSRVETCELCGDQEVLCRPDIAGKRWVCLACITEDPELVGRSRNARLFLRRR